jgi:hypothetical protein
LREVVRLYVRALIANYDILPYEYDRSKSKDAPVDPTDADNLEFGVSDGKAIHKKVLADRRRARRKKPKRKRRIGPSKVLPQDEGKKYTAGELATLAEQARLAMLEASRLAGERVIWCCNAIRKEKIHDCWGDCGSKELYTRVRALTQGGE